MKRNYYVIGSKYGDRKTSYYDILPELFKRNVVAVGFAAHLDLRRFVGKSESDIVNFLVSVGETPDSYNALKLFLGIRPGDLIAIKKHSAPYGSQARLVIGAYAVVNGRLSVKYSRNSSLGHMLSVTFLENDEVEFSLGYGRTVHRIANDEHQKIIFGNYAVDCGPPELDIRGSVDRKGTDSAIVNHRSGYVMSRTHNQMQNALLDFLRKKAGRRVHLEANYVDILLEGDDEMLLFEIKTYISATYCIRESVGQLLHYASRLEKYNKSMRFIVVGPSGLDLTSSRFLEYVNRVLRVPIEYLPLFLGDPDLTQFSKLLAENRDKRPK